MRTSPGLRFFFAVVRHACAAAGLALLLTATLAAGDVHAAPFPGGSPDGPPPAAAKAPAKAPPKAPAKAAEQDVVTLDNGSVWKGRILKEDERVVVLETARKGGGVGRYTFPRTEIKQLHRAEHVARRPGGGPLPLRDEWFLLRREGRIVGTRHLELWSVTSRGEPAYRLEEHVEFFAQGPQLPATRTHRTEEVDLRFLPRLLAWSEEGDRGTEGSDVRGYERRASGRVVDGVWRGSVFTQGEAHRAEVRMPTGTRGRLGLREHLLRLPRRVRLLDARILDPDREGLVNVRAGFASVTSDPSGKRPGHEFHWEEGGRRLISFFDAGQRVLREEISEGIVAVPVRREQAEAATGESAQPKDAAHREIRLAEAGFAFTSPDALWKWKAAAGSPVNTGWRTLGRLSNRMLLSDVRVEWHPKTTASEREPARVEAWLLRRLRGISPDVRIVEARRALDGVAGAWRLGLEGTLKKESIRTTAVVVDRRGGRVVLLLAGPTGAWGQVQPALERLLTSIRLL